MMLFFEFIEANRCLLLFATGGFSVAIGTIALKGYGLGMVAASTAREPRTGVALGSAAHSLEGVRT